VAVTVAATTEDRYSIEKTDSGSCSNGPINNYAALRR
jgi:hypothetical protein